MTNKKFRKGVLAAAVAAIGCGAGNASALVLEEVKVTATRVVKNLQDVALSVAVVKGEDLDLAGAVTFAEAGFSAGNYVSNESANDPTIGGVSIRGIRGRAGVYVDDVLQGDSSSVNATLVDVEAY